ncbi:MAG: hypothetical protein RL630_2255 [Verrucomicrobiota bacterium]|jgi:lipopolysaccharide transport system permease protein
MKASIEIRYSSASSLRTPRLFIEEAFSDLRKAWEPATHLFLKNLRSQHRQSVLGYAWLLLPPLVSALVWTGLNYSGILPVGKTSVPYPLYVLIGTMFWSAFVEALKCPLTDLKNAREILVKVRMPHEAVVLAGLGGVLFNFLVRLSLVGAAFAFYRIVPGWSLLLVPVALLAILCLGLAIGLWLAPVGLLYEDVPRALDLVLGFGFLVTPIVYPVPKIWPASLIADLNPLVPLLESARHWMEGTPYVPGPGFFTMAATSLVALVGGWLLYRVAQPHLLARI